MKSIQKSIQTIGDTIVDIPMDPSENLESNLENYLKSLSEKELQAYHIAKEHLKSSFDLKKSNGFLQWKKTAKQ